MAKTWRITIEYTNTTGGPDYWDWPELLDSREAEIALAIAHARILSLNPAYETFSVWVDKVETNQDHVREITEQNHFSEEN